MRGEVATREGITRIPVVVHVVHETDAQNISDGQVHSQIAVLNEDFRATNADLARVPDPFKDLVADTRIEFELATSDPEGNATSGITRTRTSRASFSHVDDDVKSSGNGGIDPWDTREYLNIWVCTLSGGILGYAQFPGGPPETDGVVILHHAFGTQGTATAPFDKGRTTTHEVGHYLNLSHIWGESRFATCGDDDYVSDTPVQFDKNFGKPTFPSFSCDGPPHGDMFMNYMDYVDDEAMFMFTREQALRMAAALADPRSDLGTQVEEPAA
ncbi:MAG: zinc metalloprotease [Planctomycetota bacterium]